MIAVRISIDWYHKNSIICFQLKTNVRFTIIFDEKTLTLR